MMINQADNAADEMMLDEMMPEEIMISETGNMIADLSSTVIATNLEISRELFDLEISRELVDQRCLVLDHLQPNQW